MKELNNTVKLLRFPFSVFLLPVTLFSFYYIQPDFGYRTWLLIGIWHLLVFPSSNGYNSYNDRDTGPIGILENPPSPTNMLLNVCNGLDVLALLGSFLVNAYFTVFVLIYIAASRLYSARKIRLKKFPITGFFIVFFFQGAWIFCGNVLALSSPELLMQKTVLFSAIAASFFIGTVYPLTQVYQHTADAEDGVTTLSMVLGLKGTFIFSALMFIMATLLLYLSFNQEGKPGHFWLFNLVMLVSTLYFLCWSFLSFKNASHINFRNVMIMLVLSAVSNNIYFLILLNK
ncbi:MAG: UbiA prenyltransferase family protein [Bacteroidetes bacterium]|nr:UbiA prenyltransferase family protein [Bacteroidota bacterium]